MSPIKKSAKKALRQSFKKRTENLKKKRKIKDLQKQVRILVVEKKIKQAKELLPQVYKALDKAAKTKTIKKNRAARKKSQMARMLNEPSKEK